MAEALTIPVSSDLMPSTAVPVHQHSSLGEAVGHVSWEGARLSHYQANFLCSPSCTQSMKPTFLEK